VLHDHTATAFHFFTSIFLFVVVVVVVVVLAVPAAPRGVCAPLSASMASSTISLSRVKALLSHFNLKKERKKERKKEKKREKKRRERLFLGCPTLISFRR
jgi:small-conductance mechanosensitive channel